MHWQELEADARAQLREALGENQSLRKELSRLEDRNNQLQGYGLDGMSADELSALIHGLTQVSSLLSFLKAQHLAGCQEFMAAATAGCNCGHATQL